MSGSIYCCNRIASSGTPHVTSYIISFFCHESMPTYDRQLPIELREVRVFLSNDNVAIDKNATQSSNLNEDSHIASKAVDNKWRSWSSTDTSDLFAWCELDLGETLPVEKVISDNPNCSCKLSHAAISMFDDQGKLVASKTTKDKCGM